MATLHVEVTLEDIQRGRGGTTGDFCPVERALTRVLGRPVSSGTMGWGDLQVTSGDYPEWVGSRIQAFDKTGVMEPFGFDIELPD
jgi:hypothetical protein